MALFLGVLRVLVERVSVLSIVVRFICVGCYLCLVVECLRVPTNVPHLVSRLGVWANLFDC